MPAVRGTPAARADARRDRASPSKPEQLLWSALRRNQLRVHFRRQHAAGPYILDFYCAAARLAIEVDGQHHDVATDHDRARDAYLFRTFGLRTLRIPASELMRNLQGVVDHIKANLQPPSLG